MYSFKRNPSPSLLLFSLLGQQDCMNVGQNTSGCNGDSAEQSIQFLIVLDGNALEIFPIATEHPMEPDHESYKFSLQFA